MKYSIRLTIKHSYHQPAANSRHLIRVLPRSIAHRQQLITRLIDISPEPNAGSEGFDFFGNATTTCAHRESHSEMAIRLSCHVEVLQPDRWLDVSASLEKLCLEWQACADLSADAPVHFLGPTRRLQPDKPIARFAKEVFQADKTVAENIIGFGQALHDVMTFDPVATHVDTDAAEAFRLKRGVCQDFSHIMILGLQSLGIPSAYVSGYLRTLPPPGGVKLEGADAMHAWVRAWCGVDHGWIEYDPTNATIVGTDHIVVGYGRDYSDVPPVTGHLRSSGGQVNSQAVDVAILT